MRYQFGGGIADWVFATVSVSGTNDLAQVAGGSTVTFFNAETGGTQYTDLLAADATPITSVPSSTGADGRATGQIPPFFGPDDVTVMWAQAGDGPRARIVAVNVDSAVADVAELAALTWTYNTVSGSWAPRPEAAGNRTVLWLGPTPPPVGGTPEYMRNNVDFFLDWQP